jgi:hypothetical protein
MQRVFTTNFFPRWIIVILLLSLCEAIGLAIYFHADLADPEVASMQPVYPDVMRADTMLAVQPACMPGVTGTKNETCEHVAHKAAQPQKPKHQDRYIRHVETKHPHPVRAIHHG